MDQDGQSRHAGGQDPPPFTRPPPPIDFPNSPIRSGGPSQTTIGNFPANQAAKDQPGAEGNCVDA